MPKKLEYYYRMQRLLQNATILLQNATVITKCDVYYKLRQYIVEKDHSMKDKKRIEILLKVIMNFLFFYFVFIVMSYPNKTVEEMNILCTKEIS